jgi:hypothetical protein
MVDIDIAYMTFLVLCVIPFFCFSIRTAILLTFFGGWLVLPVGHYPPVESPGVFTFWISGLALPADMLVSKAWIAATVAMAYALLFDFSKVREFRPNWIDLPVALWCLWPLIDGFIVGSSSPPVVSATLYVIGCWGMPWLLGRIWFCTTEGQVLLLKACAWAGLACFPFAVVEGSGFSTFYEALYGIHPFHDDGWVRYLGYRPIGLFEHGNQYGIWVCLSALSAVWLAVAYKGESKSRLYFPIAIMLMLMAFAAQSVGAILLLCVGLVILLAWQMRLTVPLMIVCVCGLFLAGALHVSGIVPLEWIARDTEFGRTTVEAFRSLGRGSFLWRFSQDLKSLNVMQASFATGTTVWDWWRPSGTRPWGLWLLAIGQFGIIGFSLAYGALLTAAGAVMYQVRGAHIWDKAYATLPLALMVLLAMADSLLNAFLYFPAILAAGAIATRGANE